MDLELLWFRKKVASVTKDQKKSGNFLKNIARRVETFSKMKKKSWERSPKTVKPLAVYGKAKHMVSHKVITI